MAELNTDFFKDNIFLPTMALIEEYADRFKELYKQKLEQNGHRATGNLIDNIQTQVVVNGYTFKIICNLPYYFEYLENGRKEGTPPPVNDILRWVQAKGLPDSSADLPTQTSLAFAISKSIGEKGTLKQYGYGGQGGKYMAKTIEELNSHYIPLIKESLKWCAGKYALKMMDSISNGKIHFTSI